MVNLNFRDFGPNLGTRQLGEKARRRLLAMLDAEDRVGLDFDGVNVVSNSFADECFGKLLQNMPLDELKRKTTFLNVNDFSRVNIALALKRRLLAAGN